MHGRTRPAKPFTPVQFWAPPPRVSWPLTGTGLPPLGAVLHMGRTSQCWLADPGFTVNFFRRQRSPAELMTTDATPNRLPSDVNGEPVIRLEAVQVRGPARRGLRAASAAANVKNNESLRIPVFCSAVL